MLNQILARIILPSETFLQSQAESVNIPGAEGKIGVLAGHAELIASLRIGLVTIIIDEKIQNYYVHGGVAEINQHEINIITEFAVSLASVTRVSLQKEIKQLEAEQVAISRDSMENEIIVDQLVKKKSLINFL